MFSETKTVLSRVIIQIICHLTGIPLIAIKPFELEPERGHKPMRIYPQVELCPPLTQEMVEVLLRSYRFCNERTLTTSRLPDNHATSPGLISNEVSYLTFDSWPLEIAFKICIHRTTEVESCQKGLVVHGQLPTK